MSIIGAYSTPYLRHASSATRTQDVLTDAIVGVLRQSGRTFEEIDGLAVSSFTLAPDRAIDLAWRLGLKLQWLAEDNHGGVGGSNLLRSALNAVQLGQAKNIVIVAGDHLPREAFKQIAENYNTATKHHLSPIPHGGPNSLFAMMTANYMSRRGLDRKDMAMLPISQRRWAAHNPGATYQNELTLDDYMNAKIVFDPLSMFDCVPVVSGADAILVSASPKGTPYVEVVAQDFIFNIDDQLADGSLDVPVIKELAGSLYDKASLEPDDIDVVGVYDDYPVMALEQAEAFGFIPGGDVDKFLNVTLNKDRFPLNTSGGQLSAGQDGCGAGLHFLVEAVQQLLGMAGARQVERARHALVSGYGMVAYRHGACIAGSILRGS